MHQSETCARDSDPIISFYTGLPADWKGPNVGPIWAADNEFLEHAHDYIQWLFPLREPSNYNPSAPVVSAAALVAFQRSFELKRCLTRSLLVMLAFYGLEFIETEGERIRIVKATTFGQRSANWLKPGNHNYLRLTRIIKSLKLLGLPAHAGALFECLGELYRNEPDKIGPETFAYWEAAVRQ